MKKKHPISILFIGAILLGCAIPLFLILVDNGGFLLHDLEYSFATELIRVFGYSSLIRSLLICMHGFFFLLEPPMLSVWGFVLGIYCMLKDKSRVNGAIAASLSLMVFLIGYFGLLNAAGIPYLPRCSMPTGLGCSLTSMHDSTFFLTITNGLGRDIDINWISITPIYPVMDGNCTVHLEGVLLEPEESLPVALRCSNIREEYLRPYQTYHTYEWVMTWEYWFTEHMGPKKAQGRLISFIHE